MIGSDGSVQMPEELPARGLVVTGPGGLRVRGQVVTRNGQRVVDGLDLDVPGGS